MTKYVIFIGIDISKQWFDAALYWFGLEGVFPGERFDNNLEGFEVFFKWVSQQLAKHQVRGRWYVCMEHTGIYGLALAHFLEGKNTKVVMECPLRIQRSKGLQRAKTDPIDARGIAIYAYEKHPRIKVRPLPSPLLLKVQTLLSLRYRLVRYKHGLDVAAKELHGFIDDDICATIDQYSLAVSTKMNDQIHIIEQQVKSLLYSDKKLKNLYELVISVKGIGPLITAYLLVYTSAFTAFQKSRQFSCYIGIAPFPNRSGSSLRRPDQVSFLANKQLKALISTAATVAAIHDPQIRAFFKKKEDEGKYTRMDIQCNQKQDRSSYLCRCKKRFALCHNGQTCELKPLVISLLQLDCFDHLLLSTSLRYYFFYFFLTILAFDTEFWLLVAGCWLLVAGCGCWLGVSFRHTQFPKLKLNQQPATCNLQPATCNLQPATCNLQPY